MSDIVEWLKAQDAIVDLDEFRQAADEIHRLRADLLTARGEVEDLSAEVARLRMEHVRCLAELGRWPSTRGELTAEIERLRGLLRDALRIDAGDFSVNVDEWIKRVREALGDHGSIPYCASCGKQKERCDGC